jgi:hypothetical protein
VGSLIGLGVAVFADDDWGPTTSIDIIPNPVQEKTFGNYWDEHVYGWVAGTGAVGLNHYRFSSEIKFGFSDRWNRLKWVMEGAYRQNTIITNVYIRDVANNTTITTTESLQTDQWRFRQAYLEYTPFGGLTLSAGNQVVVWGQLSVFSPVDFLLPLDINPSGFSLVKADNRMSQLTVKASVYPLSNVELTGYFFPLFQENVFSRAIDYSNQYNMIDDKKYFYTEYPLKGAAAQSYALRGTYYGSSVTMAFTYYSGHHNIIQRTRKKYVTSIDNIPYFSTEYGNYPRKGYGAEVSVPIGNLSLTVEAALSEDFYPLTFSRLPNRYYMDWGNPDGIDDETAEFNREIIDYINTHNNGYADMPMYQLVYAIGIDADFDTWFYNAYVVGLSFMRNPQMKAFWDLYERKRPVDFINIPVLPTVNIGRYLGNQKKGAYGVALGWFTGSMGLFGYVFNHITESLRWGASIDIGFNISDKAMVAINSDEGHSSINKEYAFFEPKVTFGLGYQL